MHDLLEVVAVMDDACIEGHIAALYLGSGRVWVVIRVIPFQGE